MCVLRAIIIRDTCSLACFHATGTHHDDGSQISGGSCVCYHTMLPWPSDIWFTVAESKASPIGSYCRDVFGTKTNAGVHSDFYF